MFDAGVSAGPSTAPDHPWEQFFAWLPVRVHGKRKWLTKVWRKQVTVYGDKRMEPEYYIYGNIFDVIKDEQ